MIFSQVKELLRAELFDFLKNSLEQCRHFSITTLSQAMYSYSKAFCS